MYTSSNARENTTETVQTSGYIVGEKGVRRSVFDSHRSSFSLCTVLSIVELSMPFRK